MNSETKVSCTGIFVGCLISLGIGVANMFWMDRNLDFWLSHFKQETVDVPFWLSAVASLFLGAGSFILNIVGEVGRYVL